MDEAADHAELPADDPTRALVVTDPTDAQHIALAGDNYAILVTGGQTAGRYCLIDMLVPPGGGPPPHRHDFEEMFTLLEGELEFTFRGETSTVAAPATVQIPANAPHYFHNATDLQVHMLCMCTPAGQDEYFAAIGTEVPDRTTQPDLTEAQQAEQQALALRLAPKYRTEYL